MEIFRNARRRRCNDLGITPSECKIDTQTLSNKHEYDI